MDSGSKDLYSCRQFCIFSYTRTSTKYYLIRNRKVVAVLFIICNLETSKKMSILTFKIQECKLKKFTSINFKKPSRKSKCVVLLVAEIGINRGSGF